MTQVLSKLAPIGESCVELVHPWTNSCLRACGGSSFSTVLGSLRIYTTVYLLALLSKRKIPKKKDLRNTLLGILQSTAFLSVTSGGIMLSSCILRNLLGQYYFLSVIMIPTFIASIAAILVERESRRLPLCLYVSNVATETLWNMAASRNMVSSVPYGQVLIFSTSLAILLFHYKHGLHKSSANGKTDLTFNILKFLMGPHEEHQFLEDKHNEPSEESNNNGKKGSGSTKRNPSTFLLIQQALKVYQDLVAWIKKFGKCDSCLHPHSCVHYVLQGFQKSFGVGLSIQVVLRLIFNLQRIFKSPKVARDVLFKRDTLNMGIALGGSSVIFKFVNCLLRRITGQDSSYHALPAGFAAGAAFTYYPDTTIALYLFWKMMQITYSVGVQNGVVPNIPRFTEFLYCFSTSILFHAGMMEPLMLRNSYWKFLHNISGGRMTCINRLPIDAWGLKTSQAVDFAVRRNKLERVVQFPNGCVCS